MTSLPPDAENPYPSRHMANGLPLGTAVPPEHRAWDEGFAAGRAAASTCGCYPDPRDHEDGCAAAHPDPPLSAVALAAGGECPVCHSRAASPDERLREAVDELADVLANVPTVNVRTDWALSRVQYLASLAAADREAPDAARCGECGLAHHPGENTLCSR